MAFQDLARICIIIGLYRLLKTGEKDKWSLDYTDHTQEVLFLSWIPRHPETTTFKYELYGPSYFNTV